MRDTVEFSKREKLVEAAAGLFHRRGVEATTLKDVATASGVPIGSVFYYYPTKDELTAAVVARRAAHVADLLDRHSRRGDPARSLIAFVDIWMSDREIDAQFGCPIGSLCFEVARVRRLDATAPFQALIDWAEHQFRELGEGAESKAQAIHLLAALQGISLLASVMADPRLIVGEVKHLKRWIRELGAVKKPSKREVARRAAERATRNKRSRSTKVQE